MSLSRSESRRRLPALSLRRWLFVAAGFLLFAAVSFVLYVRSADRDFHRQEKAAMALALTEAGLVEIDRASKHVWDETVWVVEGRDAEGVAWFVWEREGGIVRERAQDGYTEQALRNRLQSERPDRRIVRMLPGWFQGAPAWEVRSVTDEKTGRQAIDFYSFRDGRLLKTYDLSVR